MNYPELSHLIYSMGLAKEGYPPVEPSILNNMDEHLFLQRIQHRHYPMLIIDEDNGHLVTEKRVFPPDADVFMIQQFYGISPAPHKHDYFEIVYVYRGTCLMTFEDEKHTLQEGHLCIIAPSSEHGLSVPDMQCITFLIWIRKSTFESTFFNLLAGDDLLSHFFRTVLYQKPHANYLMFLTDNSSSIKSFIKSVYYNCMLGDYCSNAYCVSIVNILFVTALRQYRNRTRCYSSTSDASFSQILKYMQDHYRSITLAELAKIFNYNTTYLSVLIKKNLGYGFQSYITHLRLRDAKRYLSSTSLSITKIAAIVGYGSAESFSRVFKKNEHVSPSIYREKHKLL